jgi:hypothetical protein
VIKRHVFRIDTIDDVDHVSRNQDNKHENDDAKPLENFFHLRVRM